MGPKTILYAEDEPDDVFLMRRAWRAAGLHHALHVVIDGQQAVDYLSDKGVFSDRPAHPVPALVLLDLKLPKIPGLEVLEWIRRQDTVRSLSVVVFSSSTLADDVSRATALGVSGFWVKPSEPHKLQEIVTDLGALLDNGGGRPPP